MTPTLEQLSSVIARIHEAGAAPEKWPDALAAVVGLLQASRASLMQVAAPTQQLTALDQVGHDLEAAKAYVEHYYHVDPTRLRGLQMPALKGETAYENFNASFRARDEYFDFARRVGIGDVVGIATRVDDGERCYLFSLQRPYGAAEFDARAKAILELLAPHVELAKRVQCKLAGAAAARSALEASLDRLALAAFVVDASGRVLHLNAAAQSSCATQAQVVYRHGALRLRGSRLNAAFQAALKRATCKDSRSSALALRLAEHATGEALVAPLQAGSFAGAPFEPLALVLIVASPTDERAIAKRLQSVYGLTPAEARAAAMLALGQSVEEIAAANKVSQATLRTQIRSILAKTGARRQSDIVRVALAGAVLRPNS